MSLQEAVAAKNDCSSIASLAVSEAGDAVRSRSGFSAAAAVVGFETITRVRPGFLERHVAAMLPDLAEAVDPHWEAGMQAGDPEAHLVAHADDVTAQLLIVTDAYVAEASDAKAIAVYQRLRSRAPRRVAEQMPRIARFIADSMPIEPVDGTSS